MSSEGSSTIPKADCAPPDPNPKAPIFALPRGSCDSHCHIIGPFGRYPLPAERSYTPSEAPETALRRMHDCLGIDRAVIVQSQGYGMDHGPLLGALKEGAGRYRGVALLTPESGNDHIARLNEAGVCGVRFNFMKHLGGTYSHQEMRTIIRLVKPFNWHVSLHVTGPDIVEHSSFIRTIDAPVVIDHMGRPALDEGPASAGLQELRLLLDTGRIWVKMSGAERLSKAGVPFADTVPIVRSLADHAPERILWGTDWPHVNLRGPMPNDGDLANFIPEIAPTQILRQRMLVDNPTQFFGFTRMDD